MDALPALNVVVAAAPVRCQEQRDEFRIHAQTVQELAEQCDWEDPIVLEVVTNVTEPVRIHLLRNLQEQQPIQPAVLQLNYKNWPICTPWVLCRLKNSVKPKLSCLVPSRKQSDVVMDLLERTAKGLT